MPDLFALAPKGQCYKHPGLFPAPWAPALPEFQHSQSSSNHLQAAESTTSFSWWLLWVWLQHQRDENLCLCRWWPTFNFCDYLSIHPLISLHLKRNTSLESSPKITCSVTSKRPPLTERESSAPLWGHTFVTHWVHLALQHSSARGGFLPAQVYLQFINIKPFFSIVTPPSSSWFIPSLP